jgi:hypothetical protein
VNAEAAGARKGKVRISRVEDRLTLGIAAEDARDWGSVRGNLASETEFGEDRHAGRLDHQPGADRLRLFEPLVDSDGVALPMEQKGDSQSGYAAAGHSDVELPHGSGLAGTAAKVCPCPSQKQRPAGEVPAGLQVV